MVARRPRPEPGVASLYAPVSFRQDTAYLSIGERTNANGSKAFREAMLEQKWDECLEIARAQTRDGAHLLDVCVDYVGRDGAQDMKSLLSRLATSSTLPIMLDSTEPAVIEAGLELLGGRAVVNSVNYEDGDGPESRFARVMPVIREHGAAVVVMCIDEEGQARTAERKVAIAARTIDALVAEWGMQVSDIMVDALTFPIATGQEETRKDGARDHQRDRRDQAALPGRADHARAVEHLVRAQPGRAGRAELRLPARVPQGRPRLGHRARGEDPADDQDRGRAAPGGARHGLRPPQVGGRRPDAAASSSTTRCSATSSCSRASTRRR